MLKNTFSKYLVAFIAIILISFVALSGIITSVIKSYILEDKEKELDAASHTLSAYITAEAEKTAGIEFDLSENARLYERIVTPMINYASELQIILTDENGNIFLSTIDVPKAPNGLRVPVINQPLGAVNVSLFKAENDNLVHYGRLGNFLAEKHVGYAEKIIINGSLKGYAIALTSIAREDTLISLTRNAVFNSSAWVMIAAVIAVYFITERIIHPLRNMTAAAKKFAKGDFETRVAVYGEDEVAALGKAFNNMADSLENLEKMRNSFLASVSHDLRTPMTTISGFIEGITSGAIPPEKHEYYLDVISREVHRLSRLVSQLLDISRFESGDRKLNFSDFDVAEIARIILISFEQKIDDKRLDVEFDAEYDEMPVFADKDAIYQVIYNLCHNAIKFSSEGGKFKISITNTENKKIRISVFDEGTSIPEEDIPMIFDRFYKSDKSRGLDKTGVGLGLYICKTIIDAHNENIGVKSTEGVGTEFYFTLKEGESQKKLK